MKKILALTISLSTVILAGCEHVPQGSASNHLKPLTIGVELDTPRFTNISYSNAPMQLIVIDSRGYKPVGSIANVLSEGLQPIYSDQKIEKTIENTLVEALSHQGHDIKSSSTVESAKNIIIYDSCNTSPEVLNNPLKWDADQNTMIVKIKNLYAEGNKGNELEANAMFEVNLRSCKGGKIHFQDKDFSADINDSAKHRFLTKEDVKAGIETVLNKSVSEITTNNELQQFMYSNFETIPNKRGE